MNVMKLTMIIPWLRSRLRNAYSVDERSLASLRVGVGLVVLFDLILRYRNVLEHYSDDGVLPREDALVSLSDTRWSLLFINGTPEFATLVFTAAIFSAIAMILGWRTRIATILLWVFLISIQVRNSHLSSGADTHMRVVMFWAMFMPLGRIWSLDSFLGRSSDSQKQQRPRTVASIATFGLILQIASIYLFTAILKDGSRWRESGDALYYAFGARDVNLGLGNWIFHNAPESMLRAGTYGSLFVEFVAPLLILIPIRSGWMRTTGVFLLVCLQLGIASTMSVGLFPVISIAGAVGTLPAWFWDKVAIRIPIPGFVHTLSSRLAAIDWNMFPELRQRTAGVTTSVNTAIPEHDNKHVLNFIHIPINQHLPIGSILSNALAVIAIVMMMTWNIQSVSGFQTPDRIRQATLSTGLYQTWSMFAPSPQNGTFWYVLQGELDSGEKVDLMNPILTGDVSLRDPVVWDQSDDVLMQDKYWRKYFHSVGNRDTESLRFASYTCRTWNADNIGDDRLSRVTLTRGYAKTLPDGMRAEPVYDQMGSWGCF